VRSGVLPAGEVGSVGRRSGREGIRCVCPGDRMGGITVRLFLAAIVRTGAVGWALSSWTLPSRKWPACEKAAA